MSVIRHPHSFYFIELFKIVDGKLRQVEAVFITVPYQCLLPGNEPVAPAGDASHDGRPDAQQVVEATDQEHPQESGPAHRNERGPRNHRGDAGVQADAAGDIAGVVPHQASITPTRYSARKASAICFG